MIKSAMQELLDIIENELGLKGPYPAHADETPVGRDGEGKPLPITFGHLRRARAEADAVAVKRSTSGSWFLNLLKRAAKGFMEGVGFLVGILALFQILSWLGMLNQVPLLNG
ncbi:MAG: hypothetical protein AAFQ04_12650 [Pseudomonadota bacterium]